MKIWSTETGDVVRSLTGHTNDGNSVAFSSDGKYVVSGSGDKSVKIWSTETGDVVRSLTGHTQSVSSVLFSSDGKYVVSRSDDNSVKIWSTETGLEVKDTLPPLTTGTQHFGDMSVSFTGNGVQLVTRKKKDPVLLRHFGAITVTTCKEAPGLEGTLLSANNRKLLLQLGK